jgi:hypothetical protein
MTHAIKGVLLSGLVFPGVGQLAQQHHGRGMVLMLAVLVAMGALVLESVQIALRAVDQLALTSAPPDLPTLFSIASRAVAQTDGRIASTAFAVIIGCWLVAVIEAYISGRRLDRGASESWPGT